LTTAQRTDAVLKTFIEAYGYIYTNYVKAVEPQVLIAKAIQGVARVIDAPDALASPDSLGQLEAVRSQDPCAALKLFTEALMHINTHYPDKAQQALIDRAIRGMVRASDRHSSYLPPDVYREMQIETQERHGGV